MSKNTSRLSKADLDSLRAYFDAEEQRGEKIRSGESAKLMRMMCAYPGLLFGGLALVSVATIASLAGPRLLGYAIDDALIPKNWEHLKLLVLIYFGVECARTIATIGQAYLFSSMGQHLMQDLRLKLFSHLQRLPVTTFDKNPVGRLVTRVTNDISSLAEMFSAGFVTILTNGLTVVGTIVWLFYLDPRLAVVSIGVFPVLMVASFYFSRMLRVAYREARSRLSALNAFLAENILGIRVVQLFNRQDLHLRRFSKVNQAYSEAQIGTVRVFALFQPSITLATGISMALVVYYGGRWARPSTDALPLGVLVAFYSYILALFQPVREIADKWNLFLSGMASAERIFSILDWPTELPESVVEKPSSRPQSGEGVEFKGEIRFENVWFAYEGEHWVLKDLSVVIRPGMRVGVVGHTGAGKTTLISLLLRFYEPQRGRILIDGIDLRDFDRRELRRLMGLVQQDVFLFSGSIEDNIALDGRKPRPEATRELALQSHSPDLLFERGSNLSMGERQMVAFARALHADPLVWILDEATANVDSQSEELLEKRLNESAAGKTVILIAHRLATVARADLILVLHQGELVESGTHLQLMRKEGIYARLLKFQRSQEPDTARS